MVDDDPEIESSPREGSSTVWSDTFATVLEANIEFHRTLEMEGITRRNCGAIAHHHLLSKNPSIICIEDAPTQ